MKKLLIITLISASASSFAVTKHDNEVVFVGEPGAININFEFLDSNITGGQPVDNYITQHNDGNKYHVLIGAGRKGSNGVADSFKKETDGKFIVAAGEGKETGPDALNFYWRAKMIINGSPVKGEVLVGQGHYLFTNNWWFGTTEKTQVDWQNCGTYGYQMQRMDLTTEDGSTYQVFNSARSNTFPIYSMKDGDILCKEHARHPRPSI